MLFEDIDADLDGVEVFYLKFSFANFPIFFFFLTNFFGNISNQFKFNTYFPFFFYGDISFFKKKDQE